MKKALISFLFLLVCFTLCAQQKYALVIGNGNYTGISKLTNPVNDANDMALALQGLGFTVDKVLDGSLDQMESAISRFRNKLGNAKNSYGFVFYAGHGVQSNGENYLLPVDINIDSENRLRYRAVAVQSLLDELNDAGNSLNVIVLDACRDNPFGWSRSGSRGLVVVARQHADSIIVYATGAGQKASDGAGRNGLFTSHLLKNIKTSGLEIKEMFNRTGADVSQASGRQQIPAVYNQFFGSAYLAGGQSAPPPASNQIVPIVPDSLISASSAVGNIKLKSEVAGAVMIDGVEIGTKIKAGGTMTVTNVSAGRTEVAVKKDDGKIIKVPKEVIVQQGQTENVLIMEYTIPNWVQTLPQTNERMAYFVGKSERMENYENFLEAKAGALMDVLTQFSFYEGAKIQGMYTDYSREGENYYSSCQENIARITVKNNSAGLYQQAEWMADDGTLYMLCTFAPGGRKNPKPDFPVFFRDCQLKDNRIYFTAMAVSKYNTGELAAQAEQSAKMQALLWLGSNVNGEFTNYSKYDNGNGNESFEVVFQCTSQINIQALSFQEEMRHIQIEQDKMYHYYGLYSISAAIPGSTNEYECYNYLAKYGYTDSNQKETFEKQINFNGNHFTHNRPYSVRQAAVTNGEKPAWLNYSLLENYFWGIGFAANSSMEIQNVMAAIKSVTEIARKMNKEVQSMLSNYAKELGIDESSSKESGSNGREVINANMSKLIKTQDSLLRTGTWQRWELSKR